MHAAQFQLLAEGTSTKSFISKKRKRGKISARTRRLVPSRAEDAAAMLFINASRNEVVVGERKEGEFKLKEWECVRVESHSDVGKTIEKRQKMGWRLNTYWPIHIGKGTDVDHFLLFEKGE